MSGTGECDEVRPALGVYVLGAVEPADRRLIDRHLAGCTRCRSELAGLAGLPALLGKVSADEVAGVVAADVPAILGQSWLSGQALRSQLASAARVRRNRLRAWISAAAVAGAVVGSVAVVAARHVERPPARSPLAHRTPGPPRATGESGYVTTARVTNPRTRVSATVRYAREGWGLLLGVRVSGVAIGTPCLLEVVDTRGRATTAGGWTVDGSSGTWYLGSSSLSLDNVSGFIVASGGKILVAIPVRERGPRGGGGGRRRQVKLLPHDRRSAPTFGVTRPPTRGVRQGAGSVQMTSHTRPDGRTRTSGDSTHLVLTSFVRPSRPLRR